MNILRQIGIVSLINFRSVRLRLWRSLVIVVGTWSLFRQSLHLLFDGVPDHVDLGAVQALLESLPGVTRVHDLHVWAMGTTDVALTAHLVMPAGAPGDDFLRGAASQLEQRFRIAHSTIQVVREPFMPPCAAPASGRR